MFAFLKRTIVVLLGFLLIAFLIWYFGPYFAFGTYQPLASVTARLIAIGLVVFCWLVAKAVKRFRAYRKSDKLLAAVVAQPQQPERNRTPAEVQKLRERFDEAVAALKEQRRSGHSLYDLPWYVIIGAPGSGKTTALLNSGLKFPIEQRVGKGALRGVGGTRNCDWWFTDEAIFLDTAGRYTTQDSDAASDSLGWSEFLSLLKKHRARRPINGVILTINAHDLIVEGAPAREAHVEAARSRLDELNRELNIQLPVYLMVTKCDLVDGFAEYFEDLTAEGRAQVWGVTFPYEQTVANEAPLAYPAEFDALMTRLNERVYERLEHVRDTRRRAKIFAFPQQMATLRESLTQFVSDVFDSRQFTGQVLLRGVYFTSGTQDGTPIDRLLGSIGRTFGAVVRPSSGPGKAYFVESLLKDVMIGESGLAGINRRLEAKKAAAQLGLYIAAGLVTVLGVMALWIGYTRNRDYLERTAVEVAALDKVPPVPVTAAIDRIVPRLDAIRAIVESADRYRDSTSLFLRWGLYQGASIRDSAHDAYLRELDIALMPRVAAMIRSRLIQYSSEPEKLFTYFKGYLMLGEPEHVDKAHLQQLTELEWKRGGPGGSGPALSKHFQAVMDEGTLRPVPLDPTLVAQVRSSLVQSPMAKILYEDVRRSYTAKGDGIRLDQLVGLDVERVFGRKSGPWSTPMPRLYTREVFKQITSEGQVVLLKQLSDDAWVWGQNAAASLSSTGALVSGVLNHYERDYIRAWDEFLDDLEFKQAGPVSETNGQLRILTSPGSAPPCAPRVVDDNTKTADTTAPEEPKGTVAEARKKLGDLLKPVQEAAGLPTKTPGMLVTSHFQWVRQLTAGQAGQTQLDGVLNALTETQKQLDTLGPDIGGASSEQILASSQLRQVTVSLRQQIAVLPDPLRNLLRDIPDAPRRGLGDAETKKIEGAYDALVRSCEPLIDGRYPFASTQQEVQVTAFGDVFGYGGLFDKFFTDQVAKYVDASEAGWAWKPESVSPSRPILQQIQAAFRVRDLFFAAGSKSPDVNYAVTIIDLDATTTRVVLQVDGQIYDGYPQKPVRRQGSWPGKMNGDARFSVEGRFFVPPTIYTGQWAWFRMIDANAEGPADAQQQLRLRLQAGNQSARVIVEGARASNPFAQGSWRQFTCGS
jgi:type VI secretion system protein ImpL